MADVPMSAWSVGRTPGVTGVPEAWRCDVCEQLIYNVDARGYLAPGAPMPKYWSVSKPAVCTACYQMATVLHEADHNEYWKKLHAEWRLEEARAKDAKERQTGERDYFTGI